MIKYDSCDYDSAIKRNSAEYKSVEKPQQRESFFSDMNQMSFGKLRRKYLEWPIKKKAKKVLIKILRTGDSCNILQNSNYGLLVLYDSEGN